MKQFYNQLADASFGVKLFAFLCLELAGFCLTSFFTVIIYYLSTGIVAIRLALAAQNICLFIVPALCTAALFSNNTCRYLHADKSPDYISIAGVLCCLTAATPLMNIIIAWNESVQLPGSLAALESWLKTMEQAAQSMTREIMQMSSGIDLAVMLLIVGILTGIGEEFVFRGIVQRLLMEKLRNCHAAVWIAAFLFSAIHFQFYGFIPRMLLGAFFGYLLVWSGNIWLPVIAHAFNNSIAIICAYIGGVDPDKSDSLYGLGQLGTREGEWIWVVASALLTIALLYTLRKYYKTREIAGI